jgi:hypothetical protein
LQAVTKRSMTQNEQEIDPRAYAFCYLRLGSIKVERERQLKLQAVSEKKRDNTLGSLATPEMFLAFSMYFLNSGSGLALRLSSYK